MEVESHEDDKNCSVCESEVGDGDHKMGCQWCGLWTHRKCLKPKMSEAEYKAISNSKNDNMMYFCTKCQPMVGITLRFFNEVVSGPTPNKALFKELVAPPWGI